MDVKGLMQERSKLIAAADELLKKADSEKRALTVEEEAKYNELMQKQAELKTEAEKLGRSAQVDELKKELSQVPSWQQVNTGSGTPERRGPVFTTKGGQEIRALLPSEKLADGGAEPLSLGKIIRGIAISDWTNADAERRAMSGLQGSGGGWGIPTQVASQVIDLARTKAVCVQAGALSLPMETSELTVLRVSRDPTGYWRQQSAEITASEATFDALIFEAQTLGCLAYMPVELVEDAVAVDNAVQNAIAQALGLELDRVALLGSGSGEPRGLLSTKGVSEVSMGTNGAYLIGYNQLSEAYQKILEANGLASSCVMSPRTWGVLDRLRSEVELQRLEEAPSYLSLKKFVTTTIPNNQVQGTATNCSSVVIGDFSQMAFGIRTQLTLEASRVAGDAFKKLQVAIRAYLRADVGLLRPSHFCAVKGIKPAA